MEDQARRAVPKAVLVTRILVYSDSLHLSRIELTHPPQDITQRECHFGTEKPLHSYQHDNACVLFLWKGANAYLPHNLQIQNESLVERVDDPGQSPSSQNNWSHHELGRLEAKERGGWESLGPQPFQGNTVNHLWTPFNSTVPPNTPDTKTFDYVY